MKRLFLFAAGFLLAASAPATTVIDSFDDVKGATNSIALVYLNGTGPGGIGFSTGYEQGNSFVAVLKTNDLSVALANYVSGQSGYTQNWSVAATPLSTGSPAARRTQSRSTPQMSGTIWFSFLASLLNPSGDVALIFNGTFASSGQLANTAVGMRVGLGSYYTNRCKGALGVGPIATGSAVAELGYINNGVNGAITPGGFVPTNGTAGLVLGRIDSDPVFGYPRVSIWYNPDVPNAASLPAPTISFVDTNFAFIPTSITRLGYQNVRSTTLGVQDELLDNVKVSDELNGFDIVYKNVPLPYPMLNVSATVAQGSEQGPTNIVFTITSDRAVATDIAIPYVLSGVATNGYVPFSFPAQYTNADFVDPNFNPDLQASSLTIRSGQSNATVVLQVIDDALPEGNESVIITLQEQTGTYLLGTASAAATILDNNDAGVSLQYMFTRTPQPQVWDTNMVAAPAVTAGIGGNSYSGAYYISPDAAYSVGGNNTTNNEADAVANGDYMGIAITPTAGRTLAMTNFEFQAVYGNYLNRVPGATGAVVFVRTSLDNFTTNLAQFVLLPDTMLFPGDIWYSNFVALGSEFSNAPGKLEFRLYIYDDSDDNQVGVRIDNLYFRGSTAELPPGINQVVVSTNVINAAEPATPGQFTITRIGDTTSPLVVNYTVGGTASNGVDYVLLPGTVTIPAGESNGVVTVMPVDDQIPEPIETVILSLASGPNYGVLTPSSATLNLADDGDLGIGGVVAYFFNENANTGPSLSAVAAPSIQLTNSVTGLNSAAGPGIGAFGQNGGTGVGHGYANSQSFSPPSSFYFNAGYLSTNADQALAGGDYLSFTVGAVPGQAVTLTNFSARLKLQPTTGQTAWAFLRSSADNFATDLGSVTVQGTDVTPDPWLLWNVPLALNNVVGAVEFRVYAYASRVNTADILRLDDATFYGNVGALPPGFQVVSVVASDPNAAEPGTDTGAFTLSRHGDASAPLTVNYAMSGTASNGVDYVALSGTASFAAGQTSLVITVAAIDDNRPEPTETAVLSLLPGPEYSLGFYSTATVYIADDGDTTPLFTFAASDTNAYERVPTLLGAFSLNRVLGDMASTVTINFTLGGTAVLGVDYISTATNSVTFTNGVTSQTIGIIPIDNALVDGNRTVTLTLQATPGFIVDPPTTGTVTIVDDETPPATVLWSDNFDAGTSAANYAVKAGSDSGVDDYEANFAFDYSTIGVPPAPGSTTTIGLRLNANAQGAPAGVNFYPAGQTFSNNFALRFNLYLSMDPAAGADNEAAYFGINQTGLATNWIGALSGVYTNYGEGIWATVAIRDPIPGIATLLAATNSGAAPIFVASTGNLPALFNSPPYAQAGRPNNAYNSTNQTWLDCELSQVAGIISLKLNNTVVLQYTNATPFTNGNIFVGYGDPFATVGSANCFALFDNLRVVALAAPAAQPVIKSIAVAGTAVTISFAGAASDLASGFKLQSSATVDGSFADDNSAVITGGGGAFQAATTVSGSARFYKIRR